MADATSAPTSPPEDDWSTKPPYAPPSASFSRRWTGTCHCARVVYHISRARPLATKYCHCRTCQALHGAPFQWAAIFEKSDLAFERGGNARDLVFYNSGSRADARDLPCKVACAHCRSPIMDEGRNMALVFPTLLEGEGDKSVLEPECHIFYSQSVCAIPDGKPKWAELDGKSLLMAEN
jgi:hypothetical protein